MADCFREGFKQRTRHEPRHEHGRHKYVLRVGCCGGFRKQGMVQNMFKGKLGLGAFLASGDV